MVTLVIEDNWTKLIAHVLLAIGAELREVQQQVIRLKDPSDPYLVRILKSFQQFSGTSYMLRLRMPFLMHLGDQIAEKYNVAVAESKAARHNVASI